MEQICIHLNGLNEFLTVTLSDLSDQVVKNEAACSTAAA